MLNKNIETFMCCDKPSKTAQTILFGAPYDSTTSYRPGTRFGPAAIRHESYGIESYSPYLDQDLEDCPVTDCGDLELCFGNSDMALSAIEQQTSEILSAGKRPFMLGGEHLVTLGLFGLSTVTFRIFRSSTLTPMPIFVRITWATVCRMPVYSDAAMKSPKTAPFSSLASVPGTAVNFVSATKQQRYRRKNLILIHWNR